MKIDPAVNSERGKEARGATRPTLSVLIPVYNERDTIVEALERVRALDVELEIIVVDDASTDGSTELLERESDLILIKHLTNQGKGSAIRTALSHVQGRIVAIQDADLEYDPQDLLRLMEPILAGDARVVYGSRFLDGRPRMRVANYVCNRLLAFAANVLYRARITDEATCYKVFDTALLRSIPLSCRRFEFCPEVTAKVRKRGELIVELPITYSPRSLEAGKKVRYAKSTGDVI